MLRSTLTPRPINLDCASRLLLLLAALTGLGFLGAVFSGSKDVALYFFVLAALLCVAARLLEAYMFHRAGRRKRATDALV